MNFVLRGTPSDQLPDVLASGTPDTSMIMVSMSAREQAGQDAAYLVWHTLDHRPEQYRIAGIRHSIRVVSTPACRAARAWDDPRYSAVDHVITYFFAPGAALDKFRTLSDALYGERRPFRLPSVSSGYFQLEGKAAAPRAIASADVIPWRPALGLYLIVEQGAESPAALTEVAGVAGVWWFRGGKSPKGETFPDNSGVQLTYCFLDDDPVTTAERLRQPLEQRWAAKAVKPLLAAPFFTVVPFEWKRYLP